MNGILVVNKPCGITSQQVVGRVRRILGIKKVGHTGTLDPNVDGVLALVIGNATRLAEYLLDHDKVYAGEVTFGSATDTQDAFGEVIAQVESVTLTEAQIHDVFSRFQGEIIQIPPAYSALKVNGQRAYELARRGQPVQLKPRKVIIYSLKIIDLQLELPNPRVQFSVACSKGTYVRTLCHDFGREIGVPAHMSKLTRVRSGPFRLEDAYTLEQIEQAQANGQIAQILVPSSVAVQQFPKYAVAEKQERRVVNGMEMTFANPNLPLFAGDRIRIENSDGRLLAIYRITTIDESSFNSKPEKVFKE